MIHRGFLYGLLITVNLVLAEASILTPLKIESPLHAYKTGLNNEFDYILKRSDGSQNVDESPDSKERRSQMGSSFIRFGRSHHQGSLESPDESVNANNLNSASRTSRGRSDVIIRFGRADLSRDFAQFSPLGRGNLQKLANMCPAILTTESGLHNELLVRLCLALQSSTDDNY